MKELGPKGRDEKYDKNKDYSNGCHLNIDRKEAKKYYRRILYQCYIATGNASSVF